jgi:hypothetical protein
MSRTIRKSLPDLGGGGRFLRGCQSVLHGRGSGWDAFGPRRRITRSVGQRALRTYWTPAFELYRGISQRKSPPLYLRWSYFRCWHRRAMIRNKRSIVRANIGVDEASGAMRFAGHLPKGWVARLMGHERIRII